MAWAIALTDRDGSDPTAEGLGLAWPARTRPPWTKPFVHRPRTSLRHHPMSGRRALDRTGDSMNGVTRWLLRRPAVAALLLALVPVLVAACSNGSGKGY